MLYWTGCERPIGAVSWAITCVEKVRMKMSRKKWKKMQSWTMMNGRFKPHSMRPVRNTRNSMVGIPRTVSDTRIRYALC